MSIMECLIWLSSSCCSTFVSGWLVPQGVPACCGQAFLHSSQTTAGAGTSALAAYAPVCRTHSATAISAEVYCNAAFCSRLCLDAQFCRCRRYLGVCPTNMHRMVTQALFAPFSASEMPLTLDVHKLGQLLQRPPACSVPVLPQDFPDIQELWPASGLWPPLFKQAHEHAGELGRFLHTALSCSWPTWASTEMDLVSTWQNIGYGLPAQLHQWRNLPVTMARSVCCKNCFA